MSDKVFIDTDIFLRFLVADNHKTYLLCKKFLEKVEKGETKASVSCLVLFEVIWTLTSLYKISKSDVADRIVSLIAMKGLEVEHKKIFLQTLHVWVSKNVDFNDAFNTCWAEETGISKIYSYDKHFDKMNVKRLEP